MAFRVSAGNDDKSMSIDVAVVSETTGRLLAVVATEAASASGVGRSGLEKRREEARNADVVAVVTVRKMLLVNLSSSPPPLSGRAAIGCSNESCGRLTVTDLVLLGIENASAPLRQEDDTINETVAKVARKQR